MKSILNKEFWDAACVRACKTFFQAIIAVWGPGQLIIEVDWKFALISGFSAALLSVITSLVCGLPEVE